ncbi:MAG: hypothetical protein CTY12_04965 [Methylotenera sp.]|nr:MAG: hypothetical protein CTY12_04965 [Methylotenera sp.]
MKFLKEVLSGVKRIDDEQPEDDLNLDGEFDFDIDPETGFAVDPSGEEHIDDSENPDESYDVEFPLDDSENPDENPDEFDGEESPNDESEMDGIAAKATEDPDKQGVVRNVKGAHLVYKRQGENGTYEELWIYNHGNNLTDSIQIRRGIISGTDIPINKTASPDGKQSFSVWTVGNAEMVQITGLPN